MNKITFYDEQHGVNMRAFDFSCTRLSEEEFNRLSYYDYDIILRVWADFDTEETRDIDEVGNVWTEYAHMITENLVHVLISEEDPDTKTSRIIVADLGKNYWCLGHYNDSSSVSTLIEISKGMMTPKKDK